jgi:hypothetical protein
MNRLFEHDVDLRKTDPTARCPFATAGLLPFLQFSVAGAAHCCRSAPSTIDSTKQMQPAWLGRFLHLFALRFNAFGADGFEGHMSHRALRM